LVSGDDIGLVERCNRYPGPVAI